MTRGQKIPEVLIESEQEALLAQPNPRYPTVYGKVEVQSVAAKST